MVHIEISYLSEIFYGFSERSLSAMSLTFIIMVTPWAILQVITSVTMEQPLSSIDFTVNILFTSYNYLGPFIFWLLNPRMRRSADLALYNLVRN